MEWNNSVWILARPRSAHAPARHRHARDHQPLRVAAADQDRERLVVEVTDGTDEYNAKNYRVSFFYDLAKAAVNRMAFALAHELKSHGRPPSVAHAGWLRSERCSRRTASAGNCSKPPRFSRTRRSRRDRRYVGRAVAAMAADPDVARGNGESLSSGQLAKVTRFTDLDGSHRCLGYLVEVQDPGKPPTLPGYADLGGSPTCARR